MEAIKEFFTNSTWFGFTGTPIFDVNKKQAKGRLARTTPDPVYRVLQKVAEALGCDDILCTR